MPETTVEGRLITSLPADPDHAHVEPLPPVSRAVAGSTVVKEAGYKLVVSNNNGYLSHVHLECCFPVSPPVMFALFCNPDNSHIFRDIKRVGWRKVVLEEPGRRLVQVEQVAEFGILWLKREFKTVVEVDEDQRNAEDLRVTFSLLHSDLLGKFNGGWTLVPHTDKATGAVHTMATLEQDVLPKGVPPVLARVPLLGGLLRGVSVNAIRRMMADVQAVVAKVKEGVSLEQLLQPGKPVGSPQQQAHAVQAVERGTLDTFGCTSFAVDEDSFSDSGDPDVSPQNSFSSCVKLVLTSAYDGVRVNLVYVPTSVMHAG